HADLCHAVGAEQRFCVPRDGRTGVWSRWLGELTRVAGRPGYGDVLRRAPDGDGGRATVLPGDELGVGVLRELAGGIDHDHGDDGGDHPRDGRQGANRFAAHIQPGGDEGTEDRAGHAGTSSWSEPWSSASTRSARAATSGSWVTRIMVT